MKEPSSSPICGSFNTGWCFFSITLTVSDTHVYIGNGKINKSFCFLSFFQSKGEYSLNEGFEVGVEEKLFITRYG